MSPYSSCEDTDDVFDTDLDQTFSMSVYGGSGSWYESITAESEKAYNVVADTLGAFVDTITGEKKNTDTMSPELDTTDLLANEKNIDFSEEQSFGFSSGYDNNEENNGVMVDKIGDYNKVGEEDVRVGTSVSNYFNDFTTRVVADYEANVDNNVRHACETSTANALPVCIALGGFWGRQQRVGNAGMAVGVGAGMAMAAGYGVAIGNVFGRIQTLCDVVEDVITGNDNH